jgi:SAM-dependent methyltransferase
VNRELESRRILYGSEAFERLDESDDSAFYEVDRMVAHLDEEALRTVSETIGSLVIEKRPEVLDLMASWDSHIPEGLDPARVVGLGLNRNELDANPVLDERTVHDLNRDPRLPFSDASFDLVLNTVSVDYLTRPFEVMAEVARVLRPGGLLLVQFSNRFFPEKVVRVWREASEPERVMIVQDYLRSSPLLTESEVFAVQGRPRPENDRYAAHGIPSDPVYAVWAERVGGAPDRPPRLPPEIEGSAVPTGAELERRKAAVRETLKCPYCDEDLRKWAVPQTPFTEWDEEFMYICFNDRCPYLLRGWQTMERQGNRSFSYRLMYNPGNDRCTPVPIPSLGALRASIVHERG